MKTSPAPWHVGTIGKEGRRIIDVTSERIAVVDWNGGKGHYDAALLAAAPELLKALEELLFAMTLQGYPAEATAVRHARTVINKVKGD